MTYEREVTGSHSTRAQKFSFSSLSLDLNVTRGSPLAMALAATKVPLEMGMISQDVHMRAYATGHAARRNNIIVNFSKIRVK